MARSIVAQSIVVARSIVVVAQSNVVARSVVVEREKTWLLRGCGCSIFLCILSLWGDVKMCALCCCGRGASVVSCCD